MLWLVALALFGTLACFALASVLRRCAKTEPVWSALEADSLCRAPIRRLRQASAGEPRVQQTEKEGREKAAPVTTRSSKVTIAGWSSARIAGFIATPIPSMCTGFLWEKPIPWNPALESNHRSSFAAMNAAGTTRTNRTRLCATKWMFLRPLYPILSFEPDTQGLAGTCLCVNHRFVWPVL